MGWKPEKRLCLLSALASTRPLLRLIAQTPLFTRLIWCTASMSVRRMKQHITHSEHIEAAGTCVRAYGTAHSVHAAAHPLPQGSAPAHGMLGVFALSSDQCSNMSYKHLNPCSSTCMHTTKCFSGQSDRAACAQAPSFELEHREVGALTSDATAHVQQHKAGEQGLSKCLLRLISSQHDTCLPSGSPASCMTRQQRGSLQERHVPHRQRWAGAGRAWRWRPPRGPASPPTGRQDLRPARAAADPAASAPPGAPPALARQTYVANW